jgi:hypothetical protein
MKVDNQKANKRDFESVMMIREDMEKAAGSAGFLVDELRSAHTRACESNPVLAILLLDLIREAVHIEQRIKEIQGVI